MIQRPSNQEIIDQHYRHPSATVETLRRMMTLLRLLRDNGPTDADQLRRLLVEGYGYPDDLVAWHRDISALTELELIDLNADRWQISRKRDIDFWPFGN